MKQQETKTPIDSELMKRTDPSQMTRHNRPQSEWTSLRKQMTTAGKDAGPGAPRVP